MDYGLQLVDELARRDHYHLGEKDECYFIGEYTARRGYAFSETNQLIHNLKKPVDRQGRPEWRYKTDAIRTCSTAFANGIVNKYLQDAILVPMPPSKAKSDPRYDDRMLKIVQGIGNYDVRDLLILRRSTDASHESACRPSVDDLFDLMDVDQSLLTPRKRYIFLFDDVLTAGSHFVAAKRKLLEYFPDSQVCGFFVARRVPETDEWDEVGNV